MCGGVSGNSPPATPPTGGAAPSPAGAQDRSGAPPAPTDTVSQELAALAALLQGKFGKPSG